jgi:hypothetical protein
MTPPEAEAGITYAELGIMGLDRCRRTECKTLCPKCTPTRKNKRDRSLSVNVERGEWNCHNCHWHSGLGIEGRERNMVGTRTYSPRGGDSHAGDRRDEQTVQDRNPVSTPLSPAPSATGIAPRASFLGLCVAFGRKRYPRAYCRKILLTVQGIR